MTGKEFEEIILQRMNIEEALGKACMGRYGVQGVFVNGEWRPVASLPDFEGVLWNGQQFIFEAKVCAAASYQVHEERFKERQYAHLMKRAKFGAICFLMIHFAARTLKTKSDPEQTWAFPVTPGHPIWTAYDRAEIRVITREACAEYAVEVPWNCAPGGRKPRPDVLAAVMELRARMDG